MNLRKFKRDPADLLRQGKEIAAARNIDPRYKFRVAADIVGLYLNPPENAVVLCVDEKPNIQVLSRKAGFVYGRNGEALRGIKGYDTEGTGHPT